MAVTATIYYATFGPSITVSSGSSSGFTRHTKRGYWWKYDAGSHQMRLFVQTQAHGVESGNAPRVLQLAVNRPVENKYKGIIFFLFDRDTCKCESMINIPKRGKVCARC